MLAIAIPMDPPFLRFLVPSPDAAFCSCGALWRWCTLVGMVLAAHCLLLIHFFALRIVLDFHIEVLSSSLLRRTVTGRPRSWSLPRESLQGKEREFLGVGCCRVSNGHSWRRGQGLSAVASKSRLRREAGVVRALARLVIATIASLLRLLSLRWLQKQTSPWPPRPSYLPAEAKRAQNSCQ